MRHCLLSLFCIVMLFSCETEETYELATSSNDFIELEMDGQTLLLNARPQLYSGNHYRNSDGTTTVSIGHSTADHLHVLSLNLSGCAFEPTDAPLTFGTKAVATTAASCSTEQQNVTISYTTFETRGSPSCPHLVGTPTDLSGTITIETWTPGGQVVGTFETDRTAAHDYTLRGRFQTTLE